jgi:simple sugar transport system permease protein
MSEWLDLSASTVHRGVQSAAPLVLAAHGELIGQRAGLVNIGIEGVMLSGALAATAAGFASGSATIALLAGAAVGALCGLVFAIFCVWAARDQIVVGLAINLLALGVTSALYEQLAAAVGAESPAPGEAATGLTAPGLPPLFDIDAAASPILRALLAHDAVIALVPVLTIAIALTLRNTRPGLALIAVGENPAAADTAGIRIAAVRTIAAVIASSLAGAAGAYLVTGISDRFGDNMTGGRGFVALALVIFGRWSPWRVMAAALLFGLLDALQVTLQPRLGANVHTLYPALLALPYVLTLTFLATAAGKSRPPAALATPYRRT